MPYNLAMQVTQSPDLIRVGRTKNPHYRVGPVGKKYFNAGVSAYNRGRGVRRSARPGINNYYNAGVQYAYGNMPAARAELGDLFNDIMGSVIPGWDQRSPELKKIQIKADPAKLVQQAQNILSPDQARRAAEVANQYGVTGTYRGLDLTPGRIAAAYEAGGIMAAVSAVPPLYWMLGAGGLGVLYFVMKR